MMFSSNELRQILYCCAEELRARTAGKSPGPQPWLARLIRHLELELAVSSSRQFESEDVAPLVCDDCVGSREAATILGWHGRLVQRRAAEFDGQHINGRLVFRARSVADYAEGLTSGRAAS